ncbi:LytR/AlgR family response regulator transcription factor [Aquimarina sp. 2-A2]|uniref:LytR/AlgR family response regulator transcription factor n=1 Tax=Aquimarina sp. 2-A2 TaxID=3382644 RepID=UPI00387F173D
MHILIVEDEARIARRIIRMTKEFFLNTVVKLTHKESLSEGIDFLENNPLDLVLLDLNLNGEDGFGLLKQTVSGSFHTIIISAHRDKALQAFEYGVLDFVAKPFNQERLNLAFNRVLRKEDIADRTINVLAVKKRGEIKLISIDDIRYIQGAGVYSELVLLNDTKMLHDKSLEKLEQLLPKTFFRTHKSYLVKVSEIQKILVSSGSKYDLILKNNEVLPIGRTRYKELKSVLAI